MSITETILSPILGKKVANSETRHKPRWMPRDFDVRPFGERLTLMTIPPYKPPYRRHVKLKGWVCTSFFHRSFIAEFDLDERSVDIDVWK